MLNILHLTYDYYRPGVTDAVKNLIDSTRKISDPKVISLQRVVNFKEEAVKLKSDWFLEINSFGLPSGIFHLNHLNRVFNVINKSHSEKLMNLDSVDIIHAHKLTFEGYIGYLLSQKFNKPLLISLRQTDFFVLNYRPDLIKKIKKILKKSEFVLYIAPYMVSRIKRVVGTKFFDEDVKHKLIFQPNIVDRKFTESSNSFSKNTLFSALVMSKRAVKRKNLKNLFKAIKLTDNLEYILHIAGDGEYYQVLKEWVERKYKISNKVRFLGAIANSEMDSYYKSAMAFVLPSFSETFGMVYGESLLNGTPILYSRGTGFDGMFTDVGVSVNPHSPISIAEGLTQIIGKNKYYRNTISKLRKQNAFRIFSPEFAQDTYKKCIDKIKL